MVEEAAPRSSNARTEQQRHGGDLQPPVLWDNRQSPRVYDAFVDIWDRSDLWVAIDLANLNTPNREGRTFTGFIHWDMDTSLTPLPIGVQGVLSLVDADKEIGGFQCVPELFCALETGEPRSLSVAIRFIRI